MEETFISNNIVNRFRFCDKFIRFKNVIVDIRNVPSTYHQLITDDIRHAFVWFQDTVLWKYVDGIIYVTFDYHDATADDMQACVQVHLEDIAPNRHLIYIFIDQIKHRYDSCIVVDDRLKVSPEYWKNPSEREIVYKAEELKKPDEFVRECIPRDETWLKHTYDRTYFEKMYGKNNG